MTSTAKLRGVDTITPVWGREVCEYEIKHVRGWDLYGLKPIIITGLADSPITTAAFMLSASESFSIYREMTPRALFVPCRHKIWHHLNTDTSGSKQLPSWSHNDKAAAQATHENHTIKDSIESIIAFMSWVPWAKKGEMVSHIPLIN